MLLCAPSLGILDNWLPVLHAARAEHPNCRIVALIPDRETLTQLDASDTAHVLADEVIDATVAPLIGGRWVETAGFLSAMRAAEPRRSLRHWRTRQQRTDEVQLSDLAGPATRLLYDVRLHAKEKLRPILEAMGDTHRFSHNHGIELEAPDAQRVAPSDPDNVRGAFLYGTSEIAAHIENFRLAPEKMHVVGIARHEERWVRTVVERSARLHGLPFDDYAFVVSRPAGSWYLPKDRKISALRALHRVMWEEQGIPLVLRTHPKEHEDGTLAAALPSDEEGVSWARSRAHPFHLATRSRLGITFLSGVSVDLIALGVPVVEFLDVRGLAPDGQTPPGASMDIRPALSPYRRALLVLPCEDIEGLRAALERITTSEAKVLGPLTAAKELLFAPPQGAASNMLSIILGAGEPRLLST